ncbi:MAG: maleylacetoacetate isomerase [Myxococcales bacterium]|nr:maleylacetoacetate isomerase [Myxococcales bacterium]MCB9643494.1 maleylacetoacetate isomerase [Myxococcales bacterium]
MDTRLTLFSYFRSSASYRVRIALAWKGLDYTYHPVHLLEDGGQHRKESYLRYNPMAELPTLLVERQGAPDIAIAQSVAILEYLEECYPNPTLLPQSPEERARVRQLVQIVNSSIQPIQNLKVMQQLQAQFGVQREDTLAWSKYWIDRGFEGLERLLSQTAGAFAFGEHVTLADVVLVPQVYNAYRFGVEMSKFPTIARVAEAAKALEAFQAAAPEVQPDTPQS